MYFSKVLKFCSLFLFSPLLFLMVNYRSQNTLASENLTFACSSNEQGTPATVARTVSGDEIALIVWLRDWGEGYTSQRRCEIVSSRFQKAYSEGYLNYFTYGFTENGTVICAVRDIGDDCDLEEQVLFQLHPDSADQPEEILEAMVSIGYQASRPLSQSQNSLSRSYYDVNRFLQQPPEPGTDNPAVL